MNHSNESPARGLDRMGIVPAAAMANPPNQPPTRPLIVYVFGGALYVLWSVSQ